MRVESLGVFTLFLLNVMMTTFCAYALAKAVYLRDSSDEIAAKMVKWLPRILKPAIGFVSVTYVLIIIFVCGEFLVRAFGDSSIL